MATRQDGLVNIMTGLGDDELDLRLHTQRQAPRYRSVIEYREEHRANWMAHREVSQVAGDMFREGFDIVGIKPDTIDVAKIMSHVEGDLSVDWSDGSIDRKNGLLYYAQKVIEDGDMVAGAALYVIVEDGLDPADPLDVRRIQRIAALEILDRSELTPLTLDGTEPEYYVLSNVLARPRDGEQAAALRPGEIIHKSRLWIHKGVELGRREERLRQWWGASVLDLNWSARRAAEEARDYLSTYAHRSSWLHLSMAGLNEILGTKDDNGVEIGEAILDRRMRQFRKIASTMHIGITDAGKQVEKGTDDEIDLPGRPPDKLESITEGTGDLTKIAAWQRDDWQSGAAFPRSIAFGEQSSALRGGDNKGDWQSWEGTISHKRKIKRATELINWLLTILFCSREGPTNGLLPTQWTIKWRPLVVPSPMEAADLALKQAEADNARIERGVAKPVEVRDQRLVKGDTEGPLRVSSTDIDDFDTGLPPAQVGIATAMLTGAIAVAKGEVSVPFFSGYLQAIDEQRFSAEFADRLAASAGEARPTGSNETPVTTDGGSDVSAATVFGAASNVAQGKLAPEFMNAGLQILDPDTFSPEVASMLTIAAQGGPEAVAPSAPPQAAAPGGSAPQGTGPATMTAEPATDAEVPDVEVPDDANGNGIPDPFDILAEIPDDLMTPEQIVAEIKRRTPLPITTRHVHALAKKIGARRGRVSGVMGYSASDIATALAKDNGLLPDPVEPEPADDSEPTA